MSLLLLKEPKKKDIYKLRDSGYKPIAKSGHKLICVIDDNNGSTFIQSENKIELYPTVKNKDEKIRDVVLIVGPSGSGKSTFANSYGKLWSEIYPKQTIIIFSALTDVEIQDDFSFDFEYIDIKDQDFLDKIYSPDMFQDSLCIFDDIDAKSLPEAVTDKTIGLLSELLTKGRHYRTDIVITGHALLQGKKTKEFLAEATSVTMFPRANSYELNAYLSRYAFLPNKIIKNIMSLPSRWVTYIKSYPTVILYENGAIMPNSLG